MKTDLRLSTVGLFRVLSEFIGPVVAAIFGTAVWLILIAQPDVPDESLASWLRTLLSLSWFAFLFLTAWTIARRYRASSNSQTILASIAIALLLVYAFFCIHSRHPALPWEYGLLFTSISVRWPKISRPKNNSTWTQKYFGRSSFLSSKPLQSR
jgi:uncharacterized membrane protein